MTLCALLFIETFIFLTDHFSLNGWYPVHGCVFFPSLLICLLEFCTSFTSLFLHHTFHQDFFSAAIRNSTHPPLRFQKMLLCLLLTALIFLFFFVLFRHIFLDWDYNLLRGISNILIINHCLKSFLEEGIAQVHI